MSDAHVALWAAIRARLQDAPSLGPNRVHDGPPRNAAFPYVALDAQEWRDRSGLDAPLIEHRVTLKVFSRKGGQREAATLVDTIETALMATPLTPTGHRIVSLRVASLEHRLQRDAVTAEAAIRLVALTEPDA
jgi:Protein of unknown function (DUF3168)